MTIEFRITFGTKLYPRFPQAHHEGWLSVSAPNELAARYAAIAAIGQDWAFIYGPDDEGYPTQKGNPDESDGYPRGELGRIVAVVQAPMTQHVMRAFGPAELILQRGLDDERLAATLPHHYFCPTPHCTHTDGACSSCTCNCGVEALIERLLAEVAAKRTLAQWLRGVQRRDVLTDVSSRGQMEARVLGRVLGVMLGIYSDDRRDDAAQVSASAPQAASPTDSRPDIQPARSPS